MAYAASRPERWQRAWEIRAPQALYGARHGPHPHHLGPAVHQRRQAPRQPGRLDAAGRRLRPLPAARGATRCSTSAPPTSTARRPSWPPPPRGQDVFTYCEEQHRAAARHRPRPSACRGTGSAAPPRRRTRRLTQHFADVLEDNGLIEERTDRLVYSIDDKRFLPDRYIEGTCPVCGYRQGARRPVRQLRLAARPGRPDRALFGDLRLAEPGGARDAPPLSAADEAAGRDPRLGRRARPSCPALARSIAYKHLDEGLIDRGITRDLAWGVPVTRGGQPRAGLRGQGLLRLVRRADRIHRRHPGVGRRRRAATGGRWWRDGRGRGRRPLRRVHGQGQRRLPHGELPRDHPGLGRAVEDGRRAEGVQLAELVRRASSPPRSKRGVFMDAALEILPADCWRWYLTANSPEHSDTAFTWEQLVSRR